MPVINAFPMAINMDDEELDNKVEFYYSNNSFFSYSNNKITEVKSKAFWYSTSGICSNILFSKVQFNNVTKILDSAFYSQRELTDAIFPACNTIGHAAFAHCSSLTTISFPSCKTIRNTAFAYCCSLTTISFPFCTTIEIYAFDNCKSLSKIYLLGSNIVVLSSTNAFNNTPMSKSSYLGYFGSIYVPASLYATYKTASNWSTYSSRFVSV